MSDFDYSSMENMWDLSQLTSDALAVSPLGDVSNGAENMQSYTPTGNGSGVFLDTTSQNQIFGGLGKVLDYALQRDAYKIGMASPLNGRPTTQQQVQIQQKQGNFLFLALCGIGIYLMVKE